MKFHEARDFLVERIKAANPPLPTDDPIQLAFDLLCWYNIAEPDEDDLAAMFLVALRGQFESWDCPTCHARVFEGQPEDWSEFQGVCQNDRTSYPGNGPDDRRCDHCRCYMVGEGYCGREHA